MLPAGRPAQYATPGAAPYAPSPLTSSIVIPHSPTGPMPYAGFASVMPPAQWPGSASPAPARPHVAHVTSPVAMPIDSSQGVGRPPSPARVIVQQCRWEGCDQTFTSPEKLRRHISRKHIGTIACKNRCLVCKWKHCDREGRPFKTRSNAVSHVDCHIQGKPYSCPYCFTSFKRHPDLSKHILTIHGPEARDEHEQQRQLRAAQRRNANSSDSGTDGEDMDDEDGGSVGAGTDPDDEPSRSVPSIRVVGQHAAAGPPRAGDAETPLNVFLDDSARARRGPSDGVGAPKPPGSAYPAPASGVAYLLQADQFAAERGFHPGEAPPFYATGMPQYQLDTKVNILPPLAPLPSSNDRQPFARSYAAAPMESVFRPSQPPTARQAQQAAPQEGCDNKMPLARLLNPATPAETLVDALRRSQQPAQLSAEDAAFCIHLASDLSEIATTIHQAVAKGTLTPALVARLRRLAQAME